MAWVVTITPAERIDKNYLLGTGHSRLYKSHTFGHDESSA